LDLELKKRKEKGVGHKGREKKYLEDTIIGTNGERNGDRGKGTN